MMKNIELIYLIPATVAVLSFLILLIKGKKITSGNIFANKNILVYVPLLSVISLFGGIILLTHYYKEQLKTEKQQVENLKSVILLSDSIFLSNQAKYKIIDSLNLLNNELNNLLLEIIKKEKIIGEKSELKRDIAEKINATKREIGIIESYNEIIDIPAVIKKGYLTAGNSSNFIFYCPKDKTQEYLDLKLKFQDEKIIDKIACIYVSASERKDEKNYIHLFSQAYNPQKGVNALKIRNYFLSNNNVILDVGYFLKSEMQKELPRYEKVTCQ